MPRRAGQPANLPGGGSAPDVWAADALRIRRPASRQRRRHCDGRRRTSLARRGHPSSGTVRKYACNATSCAMPRWFPRTGHHNAPGFRRRRQCSDSFAVLSSHLIQPPRPGATSSSRTNSAAGICPAARSSTYLRSSWASGSRIRAHPRAQRHAWRHRHRSPSAADRSQGGWIFHCDPLLCAARSVPSPVGQEP